MREFRILLLTAALCAPWLAVAADNALMPVIETGVHEARINAMAPLANGGVVTVSEDKTARVWSPGGLRAVDILRPPIGPRDEGALYAVAASAKVIAVAGRIPAGRGGYGIVFYSAETYQPVGILPLQPSPVLALKISPAGDRLAVGLSVGGLRVYDLKTQTLALEDPDVPGKITAMDFDGSGRLAVASDHNTIRLYDGALRRLPLLTLKAGTRAYGLAFSADGARLAVGDRGRPTVHLVDTRTMRLERTLEGVAGKSGSFTSVAFAADGGAVFGGGDYRDASTVYIRRWSLPNGAGTDIPAAREVVTSLMPDGRRLLFATADPVLGVVDETNRAQPVQTPRHIDFHDRERISTQISRTGDRIKITRTGARSLIFDTGTREFLSDTGSERDFLQSVQSGPGIAIVNWRDSQAPKVTGQDIGLEPGETVRSAAVSPAGAVLGTDFYVRYFPRTGPGWKVATNSTAWAVHASADGRMIVVCLGDGSIRWYNAADKRELSALFIDPATEKFVQWTEQGYFDHDHRADGQPDGRGLIGYRVNQASGRGSDFISIDQLYSVRFRPDLVKLSFLDDSNARLRVETQEAQSGRLDELFRRGLPPKITLLGACEVASAAVTACDGAMPVAVRAVRRGVDAASPTTVTAPVLLVQYEVEDQGSGFGQVVPRRNNAVLSRDSIRPGPVTGRKRIEWATIPLARDENVIRLSPTTGAIEAGRDASLEIVVRAVAPPRETVSRPSGADTAASETTGKLFALTVGVGKYLTPAWSLRNPANDAAALAEILGQDQGRRFAEAHAIPLIDERATKAGIIAALRDIAAKATPDDVVVIFLAGHGKTTQEGKYFFAPYDLGRGDPALLTRVDEAKDKEAATQAIDTLFRAEGLGQDELLPLIQSIQATRIAFILDTCESATVADADAVLRRDLNTTITNKIGQASGRFVLSGSFTEALDAGGDPGHGLFTSFLLRALKGEGGDDGAGRIDISKLAIFTKEKVAARSRQIRQQAETAGKGNQVPEVQQPAFFFAGSDFFVVRKLLAAVGR